MLAAPDAKSPPPATTAGSDAVRIVADRLAARRAAWDRRPAVQPPSPSSLDPSQSSADGSTAVTIAPASSIGLSPVGLPEPPLATNDPSVNQYDQATSPPGETSPDASPTVTAQPIKMAGGPLPDASSPGPGLSDLGTEATRAMTGSPGRVVETSGVVLTVPTRANPAWSAHVAPDRAEASNSAEADDEAAADPPGVRGNMPTSLAGLATTASRSPAEVSATTPGAFSFVDGVDDTGPGPGSSSQGSEGGAGLDMTPTNDLLRQILDAIRKQGPAAASALPAAGSSVYAERF